MKFELLKNIFFRNSRLQPSVEIKFDKKLMIKHINNFNKTQAMDTNENNYNS